MKIQFGTSRIFLATAVIAISAGGILPIWNKFTAWDRELVPTIMIMSSVFWAPAVFVAYVSGRRALTLKHVLAFAAAEGIAAGVFWAFV